MSQSSDTSPRHVTVANVNWQRVLDFTQLFRAFRLAINPAKILLALLALLLIYSAGRLFDLAWGPQVYSDEIVSYQTLPAKAYKQLREIRVEGRKSNIELLLMQATDGSPSDLTLEQRDDLKNNPRAAYSTIKKAYIQQYQQKVEDLAKKRIQAEKDWSTNPFITPLSNTPAQNEQEDREIAAKRLYADIKHAQSVVGAGIFDSFVNNEIRQFDSLVHNTLTFFRITSAQPPRSDIQIPGETLTTSLLSRDPDSLAQSDTIVGSLYNMTVSSPMWLVSATGPMQYHSDSAFKTLAFRGLYLASLLALVFFAIILLAFTGASISRLTALELAGFERAPLSEVFRFAGRRLWVFIKAPITPFIIMFAVGLLITALSLIGAVPYVGEIILGVFFIALLVIAFVIMLLVFGVVGGLNLLFPTIAVEGSDAFDAMSRSFAYVYARPWRLFFYTLVSLVYGVITYLFVSFAVYILFRITHTFAGWGASAFGHAHGQLSGALKLETLWPTPKLFQLLPTTNWYAMNTTEYIGALFLHFWVYLFITAIAGYVISYYFSSHTILYLLLRRSVDGQAPTEVFLEPAPASTAAVPPASAPPPAPNPSTPAPASSPPTS